MASFKQLGAITKRVVLGKKDGKTLFEKWQDSKEPKIDENLPLGIKIGGMIEVDIPKADWILAKNDLVMNRPPKRGRIFSIGEIHFGKNLKIIRVYYNKSVDESDDVSDVAFLQLEIENEKIVDAKVYTLEDEFGLTEDDSDVVFENSDGSLTASIPLWLDSDEPILGAPEFYIPRDEEDLPNEDELSEEEAEEPNTWNWVYERVKSPNLMKQIVDERREFLYSTPFMKDALELKLIAAEYIRTLNNHKAFGGKEYCIVRLNESKEDASIEIYIGVKVDSHLIRAM